MPAPRSSKISSSKPKTLTTTTNKKTTRSKNDDELSVRDCNVILKPLDLSQLASEQIEEFAAMASKKPETPQAKGRSTRARKGKENVEAGEVSKASTSKSKTASNPVKADKQKPIKINPEVDLKKKTKEKEKPVVEKPDKRTKEVQKDKPSDASSHKRATRKNGQKLPEQPPLEIPADKRAEESTRVTRGGKKIVEEPKRESKRETKKKVIDQEEQVEPAQNKTRGLKTKVVVAKASEDKAETQKVLHESKNLAEGKKAGPASKKTPVEPKKVAREPNKLVDKKVTAEPSKRETRGTKRAAQELQKSKPDKKQPSVDEDKQRETASQLNSSEIGDQSFAEVVKNIPAAIKNFSINVTRCKVSEAETFDVQMEAKKSNRIKELVSQAQSDKADQQKEEKGAKQKVISAPQKASQKLPQPEIKPLANYEKPQSRSTNVYVEVQLEMKEKLQRGFRTKAKPTTSKKATHAIIEELDEPEVVISSGDKAAGKTVSPLLKIIDKPEADDNPYDFDMSQSEVVNKKTKKQSKKAAPAKKPKAGGTMELLMQQKVLDAVEYSCNVQHNPVVYEVQRERLEKQIQPPTINIPRIEVENITRRPPKANVTLKDRTSTPAASMVMMTQLSPMNTTLPNQGSLKPFHSKVWHSPLLNATGPPPKEQTPSPARYQSSSPPIQSSFALRMAEAAKKVRNSKSVCPMRVSDQFPSAFYMQLSKNDGTPSYSSDMVTQRKHHGNENQQQSKRVDNDQSSKPSEETTNTTESNSGDLTMLDDSNAENMAPTGFLRSPFKPQNKKTARTPLKALAVSMMHDQNVSDATVDFLKKKAASMMNELSMNDETYNTTETSESTPGPSRLLRDESVSRDAFGFDELIAQDRTIAMSTSSAASDAMNDVEIRNKLESMKRYLPSKNNKSRDKTVFPTPSPTKRTKVLESPTKTTANIQKYFSASTPLVTTGGRSIQFGNTSEIEDQTLTEAAPNPLAETTLDESNVELFQDNSELYNSCRQYLKRHRAPFLKTVEEADSESDEENAAKKPSTKTKRKKVNIEETGEFQKFVHDKSHEFAEVDEYQMVIE